MADEKVLTKDEVDALLNLTKESASDVVNMSKSDKDEDWVEENCSVNSKALINISDLTTAECHKYLSSFFRKKIEIKTKEVKLMTLSEALTDAMEKHIFTIYKINSTENYGMIVFDLAMLHYSINTLFGGYLISNDVIMESPGKIGMLVGERIAKLVLESLVVACSEYGAFSCEIIKSIAMPNLTSKMSMDDRVYSFDMAIAMSEIEMKMCIIIPESFIREFIPIKGKEVKHVESNFWRSAIETQVSDSTIDINVTLNDVKFKINDLLAMKTGDLIPIGDPTLTYVCLNKLKLFRASAGQANSKRVVKIVSEV